MGRRNARPSRLPAPYLKRLWLETYILTDDEKPERFCLGRTDGYWASKGRTKSEIEV